MKTKQQLIQDLSDSFADMERFITNAEASGGMHLEARVKLLENQQRDLYYFIKQIIDNLAET